MQLYSHPLEWIWLGMALAGLLYQGRSVWSAREDERSTKDDDKATKRALFMVTVIYISARMSIAAHIVLVGMATWSLFNEPPPPHYSEVPQTLGNVIGCMILSSLITIQSILSWRWRNRIGKPF
jgi:hypothetical protein